MPSTRLQDKVALITGAAGGVGRAIALKYAEEGTKLIVVADIQERPREGPGGNEENTVSKIESLYGPGKAVFVKTDVTDAASVQNAVAEAVRLGGRLDIMVNNAGTNGPPERPFHESDDAAFDTVMAVNVRGVYLGCKHAISTMMNQTPDSSGKKGRVLNVVSIFGLRAAPGGAQTAAYCTSKGAAMNLSRQLGITYGSEGINVNALCPGFLKTALTSHLHDDENTSMFLATRGGWGYAEDVAGSAVFLVSEDANRIMGIGLPVDGAYTAG